jgi:hypothetical protein
MIKCHLSIDSALLIILMWWLNKCPPSQVQVILLLTVSRPVRLGVGPPTRFVLLSEIWGPPLWSSVRGPGFDSQHCQTVSTIEELLGRKGSGSGLENREYCRRNSLCRPRNTLYRQKLSLSSPTIVGRPMV